MKKWKKPVIMELTMEQLSKHIKVAARSWCQGGFAR